MDDLRFGRVDGVVYPWIAALCAVLWVGLAFAGTGVSLPPGEDLDAWRGPLSVANCEIAVNPAEVAVRMEALGADWRLIAVGTERVVVVTAPSDEATRTEVAFLARALGRALDPLATPELRAVPPPPPPPPPPEPTPAVAPVERAARPAAVEPVVVETVVREVPRVEGRVVDETLMFRSVAAAPWRARPISRSASAWLATVSVVGRGRAQGGMRLGLRVSPVTWRFGDVGLEVAVGHRRGLRIASIDQGASRGFFDVAARVVGTARVVDDVRVDVGFGAAWQAFVEEQLVDAILTPRGAVGVEWTRGRRLRWGVRLGLLWDGRRVVVRDSVGVGSSIGSVEGVASFVLRSRACCDPPTAVPTLAGR